MKLTALFVALLVLLAVSADARKVTLAPKSLTKAADGNWTFERVVEAPGKTKPELYKQVKAWILANVKSADNVTTLDDVNFDIIATAPTLIIDAMKNSVYQNQRLNFKVAILFKDNKVKIRLNSFVYMANYYNTTVSFIPLEGGFDAVELYKVIADDTNEKIDKLVLGFAGAIEKAATGADASEW